MLLWLLVGMGLLLAGLWLARWMVRVDPKLLTFTLKSAAGTVLGLLAVLLLFSGRGAWLIGLLPFLLPLLLRRWNSGLRFGGGGGGSGPAVSVVRSRFFEMRLDHGTGELDGEVREGREAGRPLSALTLAELKALAAEIRGLDRESDRLLEAYLDGRDPQWRGTASGAGGPERGREQEQGAAGPSSVSAGLSTAEAYRILGLEEGAGEAEIRDAYHRLIASVHPDRGGSSFLAAQVNAAKDLLLDRRARR